MSILIIISVLFVTLTGCVDRMKVIKENVQWTSDSDILEFKIIGDEQYLGTGTFKKGDEYITVIIYFAMPRMEIEVYPDSPFEHWRERTHYGTELIVFDCEMLNFEGDRLRLTTIVNYTGIASYDDLSFELIRTDIDV